MKRLALLVWLLCAAVHATAQQPPPIQHPSEPIQSSDTLERALARVEWDAARRGVLLVVNPQGTLPIPHAASSDVSTDAEITSLRLMSPRFGRQVFAAHSITILAPTTMIVLNARPGKPNPYAGLQRRQKVSLLMASLTPAQWRALGSPQGLGMGDLSQEQQPLFLSLLPEPFALDSYKMANGGKISQQDKNLILSPAKRTSVHLRVNRAAETYLQMPNGRFGFPPDLQYHGLADNAEFFTLAHINPSRPPSSFGVTLRTEVPNRLKPTALAFDSPMLNVSVPLAEAKNIGDLVQRIARATRRELYVDERVGQLPVWIRGAERSVRAGDVLEALSLAVTGTFRKVGPAFVLTSDLEGIGTRYARLADWTNDAVAQQQMTLEAADHAAVPRPEQYIDFAPDYPFAFNAAQLQKLTADGPEHGQQSQYDVPLASLPPRQQAVIQSYFAASQQKNAEGDRVKVWLTNRFSYVVPDIGPVNEEDVTFGNIGLPAPPVPVSKLPDTTVQLPAEFATRALLVRPANGREATRYAAFARLHGLNQLWVEVEEGPVGQKLLKEAVAAGKENHVDVTAVLRLLLITAKGVQGDAPPNETRDRNLLDETGSTHALRVLASPAGQYNMWMQQRFAHGGDWLRPDSPATQIYLQRRLREVASTPGLSGLSLMDAGGPGYLDRGSKLDLFAFTNSNDFGYTPALRLAYLRQSGYDPIDLIGGQNIYLNADLSLPFFPDQTAAFRVNEETGQLEAQGSRTALQDWAAYRYKANADLLVSLHTFLRTNFASMPLLMRQSPLSEGWWGGWNKPEPLPEIQPMMTQETTAAQAAQISTRPLLLNILYNGSLAPKTVPTSARHFALWVKTRLEQRKGEWNGVVLDLSTLPAGQALDVLEGLSTTR